MSQEIQEAVYKQQEVIKDKQLSVKEDLDQVEPAVIEAQNGTVFYFLTTFLIIYLHCCHRMSLRKNITFINVLQCLLAFIQIFITTMLSLSHSW